MRSNSTLLHPLVELFPLVISSLFLARVFIVKAIIMNFSEDLDVGIFYLSTKFELDRTANNRDLIIRQESLETQTDLQTDTYTD